MKNEQLEALRKEAEERIEKERKTHPNFNILTDRAPTPDFSITYIETSYNTDGESVNKSHKENVISATEAEKTAVDDSAGDQGNGFGEPMEVDNSSYFRHVTHHQNEDVCGAVDSILDNDKNLTYIMGKNGDNVNLLLPASEDRVSSSEECKPILQFKLDGTIIVEKLHEAEGGQTQNGEKDQHDVSLFSCNHTDETAKNTSPQREMLNKVMEVAEYQMLQTTNSITVHHDDGISPQSANQKVFACPAPLQATFDLSRIDKVDLSTGAKSEISQTSPVNQRVCRTSRPDLLKQIDSGITNLNIPRLNDQTVVSFKTPKQHVETVMKRTVVRKQPINATPLFKKKSVASTALRGTSTPVEGSACYVCPRYNAHHAALASHATQTGSGTPVSFHSRIMPANTLTPIRRPLANSSRFFCPPTAMKASTPRTPLLTNALTTISQYGTPPSLSKRNALVDYELTPQSHVLSKIRTPQQKCNGAKPENQSTSSVTQIPMSRFAFEHLKSGGTPRPTSNTEKKWKKITGDSSLSSVPKTPVAKADISQMLVDNVMRSGPAYRRRPHPSKLLLPIGKLQFEKSAENPDFSSKHTSPVTEIAKDSPLNAQEEMNTTQLVVIDSFDGDAVEKLCEDTASLSIVNEQNISSEEPKFIFDTTTSEYRKKQKTPVFDTGNYFGRRRILSMLNDSNVSVNTPGKKEDLVVKHDYVLNPSFSGDSRQPSDISASPVHIIAAKDENKHAAVLCARKIIHSEEEGQGLRRSTRNRVAPIRRWLGEKPVYRRDQQGTYELVRVEEAIVKDPLFVKYNTVDMAEVLERQKREQKQHARARKLRKFDRARRGYAEEDTKTSEPDDNSLHN
nr:BMA-HCP-4, isoform g [Brugia malayi]